MFQFLAIFAAFVVAQNDNCAENADQRECGEFQVKVFVKLSEHQQETMWNDNKR